MSIYRSRMKTPIGELVITTKGDALCQLDFSSDFAKNKLEPTPSEHVKALHINIATQLDEYFAGKRQEFTLKLQPSGTIFQNRSWNALKKISYGETRSYSWQAEEIGSPSATRAVGSANGKNPIPIILPCHRVVAKDGSLGGYSGGLNIKEYLLKLESERGGE